MDESSYRKSSKLASSTAVIRPELGSQVYCRVRDVGTPTVTCAGKQPYIAAEQKSQAGIDALMRMHGMLLPHGASARVAPARHPASERT